MVTFAADSGQPHTVGLFFVPKKSGALRIIFDTRAANCKFLDPPATRLPSAASFGAIEAPADG
eukprot:3737445-Pyramimonas_sp.AAC.1